MKRDQREWLSSDGEYGGVGWGSGCHRVCNDGYWWRAKAVVLDFLEDRAFGPAESGLGNW